MAPGEVDTMHGFKNKVNSSCRIKQSAVIENNWGHILWRVMTVFSDKVIFNLRPE